MKIFKHFIILTGDQICALGKLQLDGRRSDSCNGDSGGALLRKLGLNTFIVGVVSFGSTRCGETDTQGVYTNLLLEENYQWIRDHIPELPVPDNVPGLPGRSKNKINESMSENFGCRKILYGMSQGFPRILPCKTLSNHTKTRVCKTYNPHPKAHNQNPKTPKSQILKPSTKEDQSSTVNVNGQFGTPKYQEILHAITHDTQSCPINV